ncbi:MAG: O-antigen ligase family protein [Steroidobacteraceae bacterium]
MAPSKAVMFFTGLFFFFEFLRPQDMYSFIAPLKIPLISGIVLIFLWLNQGKRYGWKDRRIRLIIYFTVFCAVSILWSNNQYWVWLSFQDMAITLLGGILPLVAFYAAKNRFRNFLVFYIFLHCILAAWAFAHKGTGPGGSIGDENDLALVLNAAIPIAFMGRHALSGRVIGPKLLVIAAAILGFGVIATESRGGFVGLAIALCGIIMIGKHRIRNFLILGVLAAITYQFLPAEYVGDVKSISDPNDITRVERIYSWQLAWKMFLANPILGVSAGNYAWSVADYEVNQGIDSPIKRSLAGRAAHSLYFTLIAETGLVGTTIYFLLIFRIIATLWKCIRWQPLSPALPGKFISDLAAAILTSLLSYLACASFITVLYYPHFWYLCAFAVVLDEIRRKMETQDKPSLEITTSP